MLESGPLEFPCTTRNRWFAKFIFTVLLCLTAVVYLAYNQSLCSFNFLEIVELLNCVYCMGQLLEFVAFVWLRIK